MEGLESAVGDVMAAVRMAVVDWRRMLARLEKAVAMDQALTAKILRIANSPFYGAVREIKTVSEAIVRLGFVTIRNWTLVTATRSVFLGAGATPLFHKIWRQSILTAMAAQLVAQTVRKSEPETVFVGGLMQNIGQLVLAAPEGDAQPATAVAQHRVGLGEGLNLRLQVLEAHADVVGEREGLGEGRVLVGEPEQVLVRDDDQGVDHLLQDINAFLGLAHAFGAFELEGFGDHTDGQDTKLAGRLSDDRGRAPDRGRRRCDR